MNRANRPRLSRISGSSYASRALSRAGDGSTLSLDFTTGSLDSRVTFTRSTTGSYINSLGYVTSAAIDVPRFDYDPSTLAIRGLLIEGSATNLALNSDTMPTGANWVANSITRSNVSAVTPDGNTTATTCGLTHTGAGSFRSQGITVSPSTAYIFSFWAKNNGGSVALYRAYNVSGSAEIVPETSYFSQINSSTWTRIQVPITTPPGCTSVYIYPLSQSSGTSNLLVWGAQLEVASGSASSYISTAGSTVNRAADTAIIGGSNFSAWYGGGTTGTFLANWYGGVRAGTSTVRTILSTNDQTTKHLHLQQTAAAGNLRVADFGAANTVTTSNSLTSGALTKGAFSFNGSNVGVCLNGGTVASSSSIAFSAAPSWLTLGGTSTNGTSITDANVLLNNSIRSIKYWPTALSNAQIQGLTT